jgi:hypothetical protein
MVDEEAKEAKEAKGRHHSYQLLTDMGKSWSMTRGMGGFTTRIKSAVTLPAFKRLHVAKKQVYAFLLFSLFGVIPFLVFGCYERQGNTLFRKAFVSKIQSCEGVFGVPQNSTVLGAEALFVLDASFGRFTFGQAKTIDVAWDIIIGRGTQLCAWCVSYIVFSAAILRLIERHPAPFETFKSIGLAGPSLSSAWVFFKGLFMKQSKRTCSLLFYMLLSTLYVLSIPAFLSAMTGYNSRTIPWVSTSEDNNNIVPASYFKERYAVWGTWNATFNVPTCKVADQISEWRSLHEEMQSKCEPLDRHQED